jgi:hypothetical protein
MSTITSTRRPQAGPPLLAPALSYAVLLIASVAVSINGARPDTSAASTLDQLRTHTGLTHLAALVVFGSAMPLAIWTATTYRRLRTLGVTAPGAVIALVGGILASASLALSGLVGWVTGEIAPIADPALARALVDLGFATGAAGFVVPFSLLLAGVAVPVLILRLAPRALAWAGLVIAGIGVLCTLTLVFPALYPLLPVARFGGLLWMIAVSAILPASRPRTAPAGSLVRQ